ncbi:YihY/virulence factor BrkB family protein [Spirosoma gilvum]
MKRVTPIFQILKSALAHLQANDPIRMAGATAFFSFFALPPIVIILSTLLDPLFVVQSEGVSGHLFDELADLFGPKGARQLEVISHRLRQPKPSNSLAVLSIFLVLLASTTLFAIVKNSLDQLWNVRSRSKHPLVYFLRNKLVALTIIIGSGVLFALSVTLEQFLGRLSTDWMLSALSYYQIMADLGHLVASVLIRMIWFAILFRFLPDVRITWRAVWLGAAFTSVLFKIGESILSRLLINSQVGSLYGHSGAIILVLLFIFYSSLIFYYGASFTRQYSEWMHLMAEPGPQAVAYTLKEIEPAKMKGK